MLLDRSRPNDQQGFGDYLSDLGMKNGFADVKCFKLFLIRSSKKRYRVHSKYNSVFWIISGLFIELGLDQEELLDCKKPQCFSCITDNPKNWSWRFLANRCKWLTAQQKMFYPPYDKSKTGGIEKFCGLMQCRVSSLGLDFSPRKAGLYYADVHSKEEHDQSLVSRIFPPYKDFTRIN